MQIQIIELTIDIGIEVIGSSISSSNSVLMRLDRQATFLSKLRNQLKKIPRRFAITKCTDQLQSQPCPKI